MAALAVASALQGELPALRLLPGRAVSGAAPFLATDSCGAERPDSDAIHYCTRRPNHTGQHLCPCGFRWDTAI